MSPFSAVRSWGVAIGPAYVVQAVASIAAIGATLWLAWTARPALRNAAASAAVLIATPYVLDYDFVVLLLGDRLPVEGRRGAWLAAHGKSACSRSPGSRHCSLATSPQRRCSRSAC